MRQRHKSSVEEPKRAEIWRKWKVFNKFSAVLRSGAGLTELGQDPMIEDQDCQQR